MSYSKFYRNFHPKVLWINFICIKHTEEMKHEGKSPFLFFKRIPFTWVLRPTISSMGTP